MTVGHVQLGVATPFVANVPIVASASIGETQAWELQVLDVVVIIDDDSQLFGCFV